MATLVEYMDGSDMLEFAMNGRKPKTVRLGYLKISPEEVLKTLFPNYEISKYNNIQLPHLPDPGLKISYIEQATGLEGTIKDLEENELLEKISRKPFTEEETYQMAESLKARIKGPINSGYMDQELAQDYSIILELFGETLSPEEIINLYQSNQKSLVLTGGLIQTRCPHCDPKRKAL